jgi:hypothetical protein
MSMRSVFGDNLRMIGKLRVRLSTLAPNSPTNVSLPLQGAPLVARAALGHEQVAVSWHYHHEQ